MSEYSLAQDTPSSAWIPRIPGLHQNGFQKPLQSQRLPTEFDLSLLRSDSSFPKRSPCDRSSTHITVPYANTDTHTNYNLRISDGTRRSRRLAGEDSEKLEVKTPKRNKQKPNSTTATTASNKPRYRLTAKGYITYLSTREPKQLPREPKRSEYPTGRYLSRDSSASTRNPHQRPRNAPLLARTTRTGIGWDLLPQETQFREDPMECIKSNAPCL
eukprot:GHVP01063835.1.p2 GENE.GHVP01063835.1~~GHVP01063835.1.p2  ORF type:complete len:215 (+),score=10.36 GHVP01063835.1:190-834(+)